MKKFKLGRNKPQREALMKGLAADLVLHGRVRTTLAKAKFLRPRVERLVTAARKGTAGQRNQITKFLTSKAVAEKLVAEVAPRFKDRPGGYTRIVKTGVRAGDGAETALIEWVA